MPSVIGRSTSFRSPLLRRVGEQNASICQSFGCILLAYQPYSTVAPSLILCCCLCLGAAWLRAACRPRVPQSSTRGRHRLPCLSVRASRAPRACRAAWASPTVWGCAPTPRGVCRFARFARVRSRVCFLLSCLPVLLRLGHSPPPLIRGERWLPDSFRQNKKPYLFR